MGFKKVGNEDLSEYEIKWIVQVALEYSDFFKTHLLFSEVNICEEWFASLFFYTYTRIVFHYILLSSVLFTIQ